jgi:hypothetical protein
MNVFEELERINIRLMLKNNVLLNDVENDKLKMINNSLLLYCEMFEKNLERFLMLVFYWFCSL